MKEKWISSIMAGIYIAMGAMVYLSISDKTNLRRVSFLQREFYSF